MEVPRNRGRMLGAHEHRPLWCRRHRSRDRGDDRGQGGGRAAGAPLVLTHVSTSHWGAEVPAFQADAGATERVVEHGPPAQRILAVADGHARR